MTKIRGAKQAITAILVDSLTFRYATKLTLSMMIAKSLVISIMQYVIQKTPCAKVSESKN